MESLEKQARSAVAALGKRSKTSRVPTGVREIVLDYAREQRAAGASWRDIATAVGLSSTVIKRWANTRMVEESIDTRMIASRYSIGPDEARY